MDIAEILKETEELKKKHLESAQKLAEAKRLLERIDESLNHFNVDYKAMQQAIKEFLK